jgi:hypothetical protein
VIVKATIGDNLILYVYKKGPRIKAIAVIHNMCPTGTVKCNIVRAIADSKIKTNARALLLFIKEIKGYTA